MQVSRLHRFLTAAVDMPLDDRPLRVDGQRFWLTLSLGFAALYGILGWLKAFRAEYVVQDDAREYVFWMQRFSDTDLLPHDLIADYFASITPSGYAAIYHLMAHLGIQPLLLSKLLPFGLGLLTTVYCFRVCVQIFPVPAAGFVASLLLSQSLWFKSDLASATPKAFFYVLFLAFVDYLLRGSRVAVWVVIVLQALIYPVIVFVSVSVLFVRLWTWDGGLPRFLAQRDRIWLFLVGLGVGALALVPYAIASAQFGPLVTAEQARSMAEFWAGGRHPFFNVNPWQFWLIGQHSGILPPLMPLLIWIGLGLPIALNYPARFPLVQKINGSVTVLAQIVGVSLGLFFAAHALLLRLFFPTRYTVHTLRMVLAIAAGIGLVLMVDAVLRTCDRLLSDRRLRHRRWILGLTGLASVVLIIYPHLSAGFPMTNNRVSGESALYQLLRSHPKDTLVATLSDEANNIPIFAQRPILLGEEYALPFHLGFYRQMQQRAGDILRAQYSPDVAIVQQVIQRYGIKFWLLDRAAFTPEYLQRKSWLNSFQPAFNEAKANLRSPSPPAIAKLIPRCAVLQTDSLVVLGADCITQPPP